MYLPFTETGQDVLPVEGYRECRSVTFMAFHRDAPVEYIADPGGDGKSEAVSGNSFRDFRFSAVALVEDTFFFPG